MSQLRERTMRATARRPVPDEAPLPDARRGRGAAVLRTVGGIAILVVGAVHLQQYFGVHIDKVPTIGTLFLLNFAGATVIGLGLLLPWARLGGIHLPLALGGIGLAATSFVFLFISEHQPLFGFQDHGYRAAIVIALAAEAIAVVALAAYVVAGSRSRA
jgi:hypothetical protein